MSYDYQRLLGRIVGVVSSAGGLTERMHTLIDECERQRPHPHWTRFRKIGFEADASMLPTWLLRAFPAVDAKKSFKGLWFGMHNPVIDEVVTADIYVAASLAFDQSSLDWATDVLEPPGDGQLHSQVLRSIYRSAYDGDESLGNDAEYPLVLAYGAMAARVALEMATIPESLRDLSGAAAGFDSGDLLFLGTFRDGRFDASIVAG